MFKRTVSNSSALMMRRSGASSPSDRAVAAPLAAVAVASKRAFSDYLVHSSGSQQAFTQGVMADRLAVDRAQKGTMDAYMITGNAQLKSAVYDADSMFNPMKQLETEAKSRPNFAKDFTARYQIPKINVDEAQEAAALFQKHFVESPTAIDAFYTSLLQRYPAMMPLLATPEAMAAWEKAESNKVANNKLISGRVNVNAGFVHLREPLVAFFAQLMTLAGASEEEIAAVASPIAAQFRTESYFHGQHYWRAYESIIPVLSSVSDCKGHYNMRCIRQALERVIKITLNTEQAQAHVPSSYGCATDVMVTSDRIAAEAGMW